MVVIQRVRVRWSANDRGAAGANLRRMVPQVYALPAAPDAPLVIHDVLADASAAYQPSTRLFLDARRAEMVGLWVDEADDAIVVDRLPTPGAYPLRQGRSRLFVLAAGQIGRYRANFRSTGCCCASSWFYEQWTIRVAHAPVRTELFTQGHLSRDIDHRVHLYGGSQRRSMKASVT